MKYVDSKYSVYKKKATKMFKAYRNYKTNS